MHVAVLGEGALGSVYGVLLAVRGKASLTFVVRRDVRGPITITRADRRAEALTLAEPTRALTVPHGADVVLCTVSALDLDDATLAKLAAPGKPVVMLTPLLPKDFERVHGMLHGQLVAAMPSVVAYRNDEGAIRYWLPRVATTLVEEPRPLSPVVDELIRDLTASGITARLHAGTQALNVASTVTFLPLACALDAAGSVDGLMRNRELLDLGLAAAKEAQAVVSGEKTAPWADLLVRFLGPRTLRVGVALARARSAEAIRYVEHHFGSKMHRQNVAMADAITELARERGLPHTSLARLQIVLGTRP